MSESRNKIALMVSRLGRVKGELAYLNESAFHDYEGIRGELDEHIEALDKVTEWLISEVKDVEVRDE